jgi:hypothetical protein
VAGEVAGDQRRPLGDRHRAEVGDLYRALEQRVLGRGQRVRERAAGAGHLAGGDLGGGGRVAGQVVADLLAEEERELGVVAQALEVAEPHERADVDVRDDLGDGPAAVAMGAVEVAV